MARKSRAFGFGLLCFACVSLLALAVTACVDRELGLGSVCEDAQLDCEADLSCIFHQPLPPAGESCGGTIYTCTRYCTADSDCADLGSNIICSRTCGTTRICKSD